MRSSNTSKRRAHSFALTVLTACGLALSGFDNAEARSRHHHDHEGYGLHSLHGNYGFAAQGIFDANFDPLTKATTGAMAIRVGVFSFDGEGNCHIHSMANKAGLKTAVAQDSKDTDTCTYTVDEFGTGMVDATLWGTSFKTFFVIVNDGDEFMFTRREGTDDVGGANLIYAVGKRQ
jgi:hypothetical protein